MEGLDFDHFLRICYRVIKTKKDACNSKKIWLWKSPSTCKTNSLYYSKCCQPITTGVDSLEVLEHTSLYWKQTLPTLTTDLCYIHQTHQASFSNSWCYYSTQAFIGYLEWFFWRRRRKILQSNIFFGFFLFSFSKQVRAYFNGISKPAIQSSFCTFLAFCNRNLFRSHLSTAVISRLFAKGEYV